MWVFWDLRNNNSYPLGLGVFCLCWIRQIKVYWIELLTKSWKCWFNRSNPSPVLKRVNSPKPHVESTMRLLKDCSRDWIQVQSQQGTQPSSTMRLLRITHSRIYVSYLRGYTTLKRRVWRGYWGITLTVKSRSDLHDGTSFEHKV